MTNKQIYSKTLGFSIRKLVIDVLTFLLVAGLCVLGFFIMDKTTNYGILGIFIGLIVGLILVSIISRFVKYSLTAGQIAMMTRGVTEGQLPQDVYKEGKKAVKERFATVAALFAVTSVIKSIFRQIGRAITNIGNAVGGDAGNAVGSAVSSAVNTLVSYLCDCCLGWVFFRKDVNSAKATCEGAVLFFKHGKTLAKNAGRIFGFGLLSLVLIGGAFFGIAFLILSAMSNLVATLAAEIAEAATRLDLNVSNVLTNPSTLSLIIAAIAGLIMWGIIHSTFIRPFILTGVLRNYMESGMNDIPSESELAQLDSKSAKFANLRSQI